MAEQREIQYGDRKTTLEPGMSLEQAKELMARHFPELAHPKVETKKSGDKTVYVFTKQAGHKGRRGRPRTPVARVARQLRRLPEQPVVGPMLVRRARLAKGSRPIDFNDVYRETREAEEELARVREVHQALADLPAVARGGSIL